MEQGKTLKDAQGDVFRGLGWFFTHLDIGKRLLFDDCELEFLFFCFVKRWWSIYVEWQLCRWVSMCLMYQMELIPIA